MTPGPTTPSTPVLDGKDMNVKAMIEKPKEEEERETWSKKIDFLLSVIGFAVDLGNVWRFPYICYRNGGGAFLLPYFIMLIFGGLPLFYMELALGQFQRCGCLTVWKRICPALKGIGIAICVINTFVAWYYNTIIAWAVYYFFSALFSIGGDVPWRTCDNSWNRVNNCISSQELVATRNITNFTFPNTSKTSTEEFFEFEVLGIDKANGLENVGPINWYLALCLLGVFTIVRYGSRLTMPYFMLMILLVRGVMLEGSLDGIKYYISPQWDRLLSKEIWIAAAAQIFFSLGPGFGVLLALSSYNRFHNNCYRDALLTSAVNCFTSFLAGFAVFSVLGHMAFKQHKSVENVSREDVGLIFIVYPEAISTLKLSTFWALLFFFMLITLGLDTTFGGLESICTGILDEFPKLRRNRKLFVLGLMIYCFLGALSTITYGGIYVVQLLDSYGAPIAIIFVVFLEAVGVSWIYGVNRFSDDVETMLGFRPGIFWRVCWAVISPLFLLILFLLSVIEPMPPHYGTYEYPQWSEVLGWLISILCIPGYMIYRFIKTPGNLIE
ncbi:hypothetical protein KUTeg_010429, partial [Tegillarca granosa]